MRPVRIIATVLFAAAVAVSGCTTHPTGHPASPTVNPVDRPGLPPTPSTLPSPTPPTSDPQSGTWRRLAPAPIPADPAGSYAGVWTGRELLVSAVVFDHRGAIPKGRSMAAAYNPASNRWRPIATAPIGAPSITVWTGRHVLMWGGGCCDDYLADGAAYTPATNTWQPLPASPLAGRHTTGAWTGKELIVVGGVGVASRHPTLYSVFADAAAYNPTSRSWRRLPPLPAPQADATVTWDGHEVLVVGGHYGLSQSALIADGVGYNPATDHWGILSAMDTTRIGHTAVWTGHRLWVWGGRTVRGGSYVAPSHGVVYNPATNRWSPLPTAPLRDRTNHLAVWTGTQMLIWGGNSVQSDPGTGNGTTFVDGASYAIRPTP